MDNNNKLEYIPTPWENGKSPAINADNLNHIESGINQTTTAVNKLTSQVGGIQKKLEETIEETKVALSGKAAENHSHEIVSEQSSGYMSSNQLAKLNTAGSDIEDIKNQLSKLKHDENTAKDALTLDGHTADYFASKESLEALKNSIVPALEWNSY